MSTANIEFVTLIQRIKQFGNEVNTRNSIVKRLNTLSCRFDKTPLVSARKTAWKSALREMEWFLSGSNNIEDLHPSVRKWWTPWANENGYVHNNYSKQFRKFDGAGFGPLKIHNSVDQIQYMIDTLNDHPFSRRNVITTWHTHDMMSPNTAITNCHGTVIQTFVNSDNTVDLTMYQRSADMMLGVVHNWIQYWALLMWFAHRSNKKVGSFSWIGGDCHIYRDHYDMAETLIALNSNRLNGAVPELIYEPTSETFKADDYSLSGDYKPIINESLKMVV